jgi:hemin uptake protein HemP
MKRPVPLGAASAMATHGEPRRGGVHAEHRRVIPSAELFGADGAELDIEHNGEIYCLRRTSKGKLILTK